jgi:hypothetical protein
MRSRALALSVALLVAGCGRSSLLDFDDGCPPDDPDCGSRLDGPRPDLPDGRAGDMPDGFGGDMPDGFRPPDMRTDGFVPTDMRRPDGFVPPDMRSDGFIPPDMRRPDGSVPVDMRAADMTQTNPDGFVCLAAEICGNGVDDDCNGRFDCDDPACRTFPSCVPPRREICNNMVDDDGNNLVDCADPACFGDRACITPGQEICNNNLDDDDDRLVDCADPDCVNTPICRPNMDPEICDNGVDDNNNGLVDCSDPQCATFPACLVTVCRPDVDFGAIAPRDANVTRTMDTRGATQTFVTCAAPGGTARVGGFTLAAPADVRLDFTQTAGSAHVVALFRAGANQACDQNGVGCLNAGQQPTATRTFAALQPGSYWVIVQSYPGTQGSTTVTLSTARSSRPEVCNNGVDDDGNGLIDCADLACAGDPNCVNRQCIEDANVGTLIVDGPAKSATLSTTTTSNRYHPTCAGTSTGNDVTLAFTLPETAGILVQWSQTGDHVFGLYTFPPPGQPCDALQTSCYNPGGRSGGAVAFSARPPGKYIFVFKALQPGREGTLNIQISAFSNRRQEVCNNTIDDDGDGLVDCNDPDCFGVAGCGAPLCQPDVDLGSFSWGTSRSISLDTRNAQNLYSTTCSRGTGKERVVRVELTQVMALGFSCTDTGSHVLQLGAQLQPLDACDANNFNCADPSILPFGCNFAMPNLQPGRYNIIVDAFQAGSEGVVNLTLTGIEERVLEICDNGVDDDMDGATDCNDRKCVTSSLCRRFACRADQKLGLLPLDGTPSSVVVQTTGAGDDQKATSCVTASGGQDAVVDFELPARANITIEWAQVGNHAFALYTNAGDLLACDAGANITCTPSNGAATGTITLSNVAQGKYHLVVDAAQPGREGGAVVQISGNPSP